MSLRDRLAATLRRPASWLLGWTWWLLIPIRRRKATENLHESLPDQAPGPTLRRAVGDVAWGYVELIFGVRAQVSGIEAIPDTGAIVLAGHGGSWDLALISAARHLPLTIFVRQPSNPWVARLIRRLRTRVDLELLPPANSMERAYAALERGRCVVFVQDQRHNDGIAVPFFGRPALTSAAFAAMAWRSGAPIFGAWPVRDAAGHHRVRFERLEPEIPPDRDAAIKHLTALSQSWTEAKIRQRPWSWWWLHDRWRGASEAGGPDAG